MAENEEHENGTTAYKANCADNTTNDRRDILLRLAAIGTSPRRSIGRMTRANAIVAHSVARAVDNVVGPWTQSAAAAGLRVKGNCICRKATANA